MLTTWHLYPQKLALTSPTSGGPSVGIVRSRTQATEFVVFCLGLSSLSLSLSHFQDILDSLMCSTQRNICSFSAEYQHHWIVLCGDRVLKVANISIVRIESVITCIKRNKYAHDITKIVETNRPNCLRD
jgi:hypothetical protein